MDRNFNEKLLFVQIFLFRFEKQQQQQKMMTTTTTETTKEKNEINECNGFCTESNSFEFR